MKRTEEKISLAIQKNWDRKKKNKKRRIKTSYFLELSKEEIEAVKSLARNILLTSGFTWGLRRGTLSTRGSMEEMADELMKVAMELTIF